MRLNRTVVLGIALLGVSNFAQAQAPRGGAAYATIQAMVDYCSRVDEEHRHEYLERASAVLQSVAGLGDPADFAAVYTQVTGKLDAMTRRVGQLDCRAAIGVRGTPDKDDDGPRRRG